MSLPQKSPLQARKGNKVSHKAFLPTFFSEKSRLPADDVFRNLPQRLSGLHIKALAAGQVGQRDDAHQLSSLHHRQAAHLLAGHELGGGPAIVLGDTVAHPRVIISRTRVWAGSSSAATQRSTISRSVTMPRSFRSSPHTGSTPTL